MGTQRYCLNKLVALVLAGYALSSCIIVAIFVVRIFEINDKIGPERLHHVVAIPGIKALVGAIGICAPVYGDDRVKIEVHRCAFSHI